MVGSSAVGAVGGWGDTVGCRAENGVAVVVDIAAVVVDIAAAVVDIADVAGDVVVDTFRFGSLKDTSFLLSHSVSIPETSEILRKMNTISIIYDMIDTFLRDSMISNYACHHWHDIDLDLHNDVKINCFSAKMLLVFTLKFQSQKCTPQITDFLQEIYILKTFI